MNKLNAWLIILAGVVLLLPLVGITQLGTVTEGVLAWVLVIVVLLIGVLQLVKLYKR